MKDWDDEYWNMILDSGIWKDVDARLLRDGAPMSCTHVPEPEPQRPAYRVVDYVGTDAAPQAMLTSDGQMGMWVKLDADTYRKWAAHNHTECVPDGYDDSWTDGQIRAHTARHDASLHHAGELFGNWMRALDRLAVQLGWDTNGR